MRSIAILVLALFLSACTSSNKYGECRGVGDRSPGIEYRMSGWNFFLAILFSETIAIPAWIVLTCIYCPTGNELKK